MSDSDDDIGRVLPDIDPAEEYKAPWDWFSLPVVATGPELRIVTSGHTLTVTQHDGRTLTLTTLHQYPTYSGMLCGTPQARDYTIEWTLKHARSVFGVAIEPVLLRPRLIRIPDSDRLFTEYPPARMPMVTTIAEFDSKAVIDKDAFRSSGIVVWWQEGFGLPTEEHILMQLRDLDWIVPAQDWDP